MKSPVKKKLVLLDSHAIIHRAYHALPEFSSSKGEPTGALYGLITMVLKIIEELRPTHIVACYDLPDKTHRHDVYEGYKANRQKSDEALKIQLGTSRHIFEGFGIPIYEKPGFEADDILGTITEQLKDSDVDIVIASGDMDTLQLVDGTKVSVFTLRKGIQDTVLYDEDAVQKRFGFGPLRIPDFKGFSGDTSDNIPGIKGIGEKTATTLLHTFGSVDGVYEAIKKDPEILKKSGFKPRAIELILGGEEEAQFSKMLATIRRDAPITFELPKDFREQFNLPALLSVCERYELRSLATRLKTLSFNTADGDDSPSPEVAAEVPSPRVLSKNEKQLLPEALIALWLVRSDLSNPTLENLYEFTKLDTVSSSYDALKLVLKSKNLEHVFEKIEKPLIPVVNAMNERGIRLDTGYLKKLSKEYHAELKKIEAKIFKLAGKEFNVGSPKQLGVVLFDELGIKPKGASKTPTGARSTKESDLQKIADSHAIIPEIFAYRELQKLLGTYVDTLGDTVDAHGRLHTTFVQAGTTTGRMASIDPNLQNIPVKTDYGKRIRNAFIAEPGKTLLALDYSQIELRIAAILSRDEKLITVFKSGVDVHTAVAAEVFSVAQGEVTSDMRRKAKVINFGILYGMGVNALRVNLGEGTTQKEARSYLDAYFENYAGLTKWIDTTKHEVARLGYTSTLFGRRRYFEGINSPVPFIRAAAERMAVNAPIQGTQSDIIKIAMFRIDAYLQKSHLATHVGLVLQVHDELVYEVTTDMVGEVAHAIKEIMQSVLSTEESHGVPILVEYKSGPSWGELK